GMRSGQRAPSGRTYSLGPSSSRKSLICVILPFGRSRWPRRMVVSCSSSRSMVWGRSRVTTRQCPFFVFHSRPSRRGGCSAGAPTTWAWISRMVSSRRGGVGQLFSFSTFARVEEVASMATPPPEPQPARARRRRGSTRRVSMSMHLRCEVGEFLPQSHEEGKSAVVEGGRMLSTGRPAENLDGVPGCGMVRSMRSTWRMLFWLVVALPRLAVADPAEAAYQEARKALIELIDDARAKRYRDRWERVIRALDESARKLSSPELRCAALHNGARAHAEMAKVSYLAKDREEAFRRCREVAGRCPKSNLAVAALYCAAEIFFEGDETRARATLEVMVKRFPRGYMVPLARKRLA